MSRHQTEFWKEFWNQLSVTDKDLYLNLSLYDISQFVTQTQLSILVYRLNGYSNIDIAKKLNVTPAMITYNLKKIRASLKENNYRIEV